jgi:hypothetical protein
MNTPNHEPFITPIKLKGFAELKLIEPTIN